jgi:hypothetical protein
MTLINRFTGLPPTEKEMEALKQRAAEIFCNPYAAPELLEWAIMIWPEGLVYCLYETPKDRKRRKHGRHYQS